MGINSDVDACFLFWTNIYIETFKHMKYFRIFDSTEAYLEYLDSPDAVFPNVVFCEDGYSYIAPALGPVDVTGVTINTTATTINVGSTKTLVATVLPINATDKSVVWTSSDDSIATVTNNGMVTAVASGATIITVTTHDGDYTASCAVTVEVPSITTLAIEGAPVISAETCNYNAIGDNSEDVTSSATWSIVSGSQYATINPNNGSVTILNGANESNVTIQAEYAGWTATTNVTLTYVSGAESETNTESSVDIGGNTTTVTTTVTEYTDGSSVEVIETVITDANGDLIGTSESNKTVNTDGSYNGTTTNYDAEGNPTDGSNVTGDTDGNISTQSVEYDDSGNATVTGYDIDTSGSESGKTFNNDGVNTDYYAFDVTHGFILDFDFTIDLNNQPASQDGNHHNVLNAKRADPSPWYGFQIRHTSTTGNTVFLGVQFSGGSNDNIALVETSTTGSVKTYNLRIVYDPTSTGTTFTCVNTATQYTIYSGSLLFPDIEELKNLKVTIGYAVNASGNPYRYSNITVHNFELKKLKNVANPTITCENNVVTIDCDTVGASVYYRLNLSGDYSAYTTSFTITGDTVVQAYATGNGDTSDIVREDCVYEIVKPVITCDGEFVTITCSQVGSTIYYRLNESGSYSAYTTPIAITADTVVEAYSQLGEDRSDTVKQTCIYTEGVDEPVITCIENVVSMTCDTVGATIYYRLNESGSYSAYTDSFKITATTIVEAYGLLNEKTSDTVKQTCTYTDFSTKYFTIESLENNNTIKWVKSSGPNVSLSYSTDNGTTWTDLTLSGSRDFATINAGDKILFKGTNDRLATAWNAYNRFNATKTFKVYGNAMSLLYGDNFVSNSEFKTDTNHNLCGIFYGTTTLVDASDLILPATTLTDSCYNGMFRNCSGLTAAPDLSAPTTFGDQSFSSMFDCCVNMSQPPSIISGTTSYLSSVKRMFCMTRGNSAVQCQMTKSPLMIINFNGDSSVSKEYEVFKGNANLTEIKCFWTNNSGSFESLANWVIYTADSGVTFYKRSTQSFVSGVSGIKTGWTVVNDDITGV